jgi:hypothetical protein
MFARYTYPCLICRKVTEIGVEHGQDLRALASRRLCERCMEAENCGIRPLSSVQARKQE